MCRLPQVLTEVYRDSAADGRQLRNPLAVGILETPQPGERIFKVEVTLQFPQVKHWFGCAKSGFVRVRLLT
jgi:hypothetical protein